MNRIILVGIGAVLMMIGWNNPSLVGWAVWCAGVALWTAVTWDMVKRRHE